MRRPSLAAALKGCAAALAAAAALNLVLFAVAGDVLRIPGEMGARPIAVSTLGAIPFAAVALWWVPRWFPAIAVGVAITTAPFPFVAFGSEAGMWLAPMHFVAAISAALIAPRVAGVRRGLRLSRAEAAA